MTRVWEVRQISGSELEKLEREKAGLTGEESNIGEGRAKGLKACLKPSIFNALSGRNGLACGMWRRSFHKPRNPGFLWSQEARTRSPVKSDYPPDRQCIN